ncbi:MAG: DUF445 family protein [Blastocatellia bacterium]|nr:DUF445 family protein [Blastocatellia bacterium]
MEAIQSIFEQVRPLFSTLWFQMGSLILVATLHGYGAAWLAVRMLFRPREPFKIFGITMFPQGMIPRHRDRLAAAIGKAVGEELVSKETIMEELLGKEFLRRKIRSVVDSYTEELLREEYPSLIEALPSRLREPILDSISTLQTKIARHIESALTDDDSAASIRRFVERRVDEVLSKRVAEVVDDEMFEKAVVFFDERIAAALHSDLLAEKIREFVSRRLDELLQSEIPLGDMFTLDAVELLKGKANEQIAPMAHHLAEIAAAERTRLQIATLIKKEVHTYYEALPFFKKIFVSRENLLGEVDDLVNESLPKRIEETLKGDFFAEEARSFINNAFDTALDRPVFDLVGAIDAEQLAGLKEQVTRTVLKMIRGPELRSQIAAYVRSTMDQFRPHSIDSIMRTLHPESEQRLKDMLADGLLGVIARPDTSRIINKMLASQLDALLSAPIGRLADHVSEEKLRTAGDSLADVIITAIREKLPDAIEEFNVGNVVKEKIMNFPNEKLEDLVLSVAKEHLRLIELFGAIFGFFIGISQAIPVYLFSR